MILKPGNPWGFIRGKLSLNPEQALKMFGFHMNPDAHGVIFRVYTYRDDNNKQRKGCFVSNYFPPSNPQTPLQQANRHKMRLAVLHWQTLHTSEKTAWNKNAAKRKLAMSGYNLHNREHLRHPPVP